MNERIAEAEAALKAGRLEDGIRLTESALTEAPDTPVAIYRNFVTLLFRRGFYEKAVKWGRAAAAIYPKDHEIWNVTGVSLRRLQRREEALEALEAGLKLAPRSASLLQNKGNVLNDLKRGAEAVAVFSRLVRDAPTNVDFQRGLARAHRHAGETEKALMRYRLAAKLKPEQPDSWLDIAAIQFEDGDSRSGLATLDEGLSHHRHPRLMEGYAVALRRANRLREAEAYLRERLVECPDAHWVHHQLGATITDWSREEANRHLARAVELEPGNMDYRMALVESLARSRHGDEAAHVDRAYAELKAARQIGSLSGGAHMKVASEILSRVADFDAQDELGDFRTLGRLWAEQGRHTALLSQLSRVRAPEDRNELVAQHRLWGDQVQERVDKFPLKRPAQPRPDNGKIRLGFMSSDLRYHPVAYFALPLFEHYPRDRFEVYCYSYYQGDEDALQKRIAGMVDVFRWRQDLSDHEAAQMIHDDQLDMLIELGGSTHMNKLGVMAWKPAPIQASWLGYPHSSGLSRIDYLIVDPYLAPTNLDLLIEEPLLMPSSWIAMGELAFPERPKADEPPVVENGFITFGTANNPYKYSREMVREWARVTAAVPESRFMFVRPEGGSASFRDNIAAIFEAEGVARDRLRFEAVRGAHMPFYDQMDISLDTFPQTGGTTTCESLWMGVPVVTLVGPGLFERLSCSILNNAGLGDLCAGDLEDFKAKAVALAADVERLRALRRDLRRTLKASPLGQTRRFAQDFYRMIEAGVTTHRNRQAVAEPAL